MAAARAQMINVAPLLHSDQARKMGKTKIPAVNVGRREKVRWITDLPFFVESYGLPDSGREMERGLPQSHQLVTSCPYEGLLIVILSDRRSACSGKCGCKFARVFRHKTRNCSRKVGV